MTLLRKSENAKIGNKPFSEKKPILIDSTFELTKEVGESEEWNKETITERQARLAKGAVAAWPRP
jgi:hypothetical protein